MAAKAVAIPNSLSHPIVAELRSVAGLAVKMSAEVDFPTAPTAQAKASGRSARLRLPTDARLGESPVSSALSFREVSHVRKLCLQRNER